MSSWWKKYEDKPAVIKKIAPTLGLKKKAEFLKQYIAKKISAKEYHQKIDEMKTYENPE